MVRLSLVSSLLTAIRVGIFLQLTFYIKVNTMIKNEWISLLLNEDNRFKVGMCRVSWAIEPSQST